MSPDVICGCCSLGFTGTYIKEREERKERRGGGSGREGESKKERGKFGRGGSRF